MRRGGGTIARSSRRRGTVCKAALRPVSSVEDFVVSMLAPSTRCSRDILGRVARRGVRRFCSACRGGVRGVTRRCKGATIRGGCLRGGCGRVGLPMRCRSCDS